jgi:hypothetical protein
LAISLELMLLLLADLELPIADEEGEPEAE